MSEPTFPADQVAHAQADPPEHGHGYWYSLSHPTRRGWMLIVSGLTTLVLLAVAFLLPVPFVKLAPGPTFNVIGDYEGEPVIQISGATTYPTSGQLDMTTVMESGGPRGGLTFVDAIASWLDPSDAVVPRELIFPDDETGEEVERRQAIMFSTSQSDAVAAALNYLDLPVSDEIVVTVVYGDSPSDGVLQPRDVILAVDGEEITDPVQVAEAIRAQPAGTTFTITVERDGTMQDVTVTSTENPDDPSLPFIGIGVGSFYTGEFPIDFTLEDVGGPSAGLIFATGIVDLLTPEDLTAGRHVAGTGTIEPDGTVGSIGGIRQKLAGARGEGAELFLMPRTHCAEAAAHIPDGLTVVPVSSLTEAVAAIRAWNAGDEVAQCPAEAG